MFMFLEQLSEKEAKVFIRLVKNLANIDETLAKEEENLIREYAEELKVCLCKEDSNPTLEENLNMLTGASSKSKNIIYFELLGLALIDGEFDGREVEFLSEVSKALEICPEKLNEYLQYFKDVQFLYEVTYNNSEDKIKELENKAQELINN